MESTKKHVRLPKKNKLKTNLCLLGIVLLKHLVKLCSGFVNK